MKITPLSYLILYGPSASVYITGIDLCGIQYGHVLLLLVIAEPIYLLDDLLQVDLLEL